MNPPPLPPIDSHFPHHITHFHPRSIWLSGFWWMEWWNLFALRGSWGGFSTRWCSGLLPCLWCRISWGSTRFTSWSCAVSSAGFILMRAICFSRRGCPILTGLFSPLLTLWGYFTSFIQGFSIHSPKRQRFFWLFEDSKFFWQMNKRINCSFCSTIFWLYSVSTSLRLL